MRNVFFLKYFVNVNIILNFKKEIDISLMPIPRKTFFLVHVCINWADQTS